MKFIEGSTAHAEDNEESKATESSYITLASRIAAKTSVNISVQKDNTKKLLIEPDSMSNALTQALRTDDNVLLDSCLIHSRQIIVDSTIRKLPRTLVPKLLKILIDRFYSSASSSIRFQGWIHSLIFHHLEVISHPSNIELKNKLELLAQFTQRRSDFRDVHVRVGGKLYSMLNIMKVRKEIEFDQVVEYNEGTASVRRDSYDEISAEEQEEQEDSLEDEVDFEMHD